MSPGIVTLTAAAAISGAPEDGQVHHLRLL